LSIERYESEISGLLSVTKVSYSACKTPVVPAKAGTQRLSSHAAGFPPSRERSRKCHALS